MLGTQTKCPLTRVVRLWEVSVSGGLTVIATFHSCNSFGAYTHSIWTYTTVRADKATHVFNHAQDWDFSFLAERQLSSHIRHCYTLENNKKHV